MSGNNKIGGPIPGPINPDDPDLLAAESQLANVPSVPFNIRQNEQQNQNSSDDDSSDNAAKEKQKKDQIKKEQQSQAAQKAAVQAQENQKKPSPLDSSFHTSSKSKDSQKTLVPQAPSKGQNLAETTKKEQPSPFSFAKNASQSPKEGDLSHAKMSTTKKPQTSDNQISKDALPKTTPALKPQEQLSTPQTQTPGQASTSAHLQDAEAKSGFTKQSQLAGEKASASVKETTLKSTDTSASEAAAALNAQMAANARAGKTETSSSVSSLSDKFTKQQERTSDKDSDWKFKQNLSDKADTQDNRLDQKFAGQQVADQTQKADTTSQLNAPTGATGTNIAERAADVLRTQTDFINLVASVATNEKTTQVQLKDGTMINLNRTERGLDIAVTTPDSRVHRLLFDNRTSISKALNDKNIKVASLQVSMETGGSSRGPVEEIGAE